MKTKILLAATVIILALASCKDKAHLSKYAPPPSPPLAFTIISHGVNFTSAEANKVIEEEQRILNKRAINVPLQLNGNITAAGAITCDDIKALMRPQADNIHEIHVVQNIPCCGPPTHDTIVGCSGSKMPLVVLAINEAADQGTLRLTAVQWLHELGHHRGLCHNPTVGALMNGTVTAGNTGVDECVRAAFTGDAIDPSCTQSCSGPQQSRVSDFDPGH